MHFLMALGAAIVLTPVAGALGRALGIVDRPTDDLKIHTRPVPVVGGAAVIAAVLGVTAILGRWEPAIALAALICFATGLVDDLRGLAPPLRVALNFAAGVVLVAGGVDMGVLGLIGVAGVVALVLACTNAVNIIDGQDALAGGLAAAAALGLSALAALGGDTEAAYLALALAGALGGFLLFNRPPARIFLGDSGAYAVGLLLAGVSARVVDALGWQGLLASGVVLGVFAFELIFTVARRIASGDRLTGGDRFHSYDLLALRASRPRVTLALVAAGALCAAAGVGAAVAPLSLAVVVAGLAVAVAAFWGMRLMVRSRPALEPQQTITS